MQNNFMVNNLLTLLIFNIFVLTTVFASSGDRNEYFINCVKRCKYANCTIGDSGQFRDNRPITTVPQSFFNRLLQWNCRDECNYECMWFVTDNYVAYNRNIPQFYGKWPFIRFLGMQEPASVIFSLINLWANVRGLKRFRQSNVRTDSPMYFIWQLFALISINAWIWSAIFHARDYPLTELFDYVFAYSMVLTMCFCMTSRMLLYIKINKWIKTTLNMGYFLFFFNHFRYLSIGRFDYEYNMKTNIITGVISSLGWLAWYVRVRKRKKYARKMLIFQLMVGCTMIFELNDFTPIFWIFDAHSIWHFLTVFPTVLLYNFIIDDCKDLRIEFYDRRIIDDDDDEPQLAGLLNPKWN